MTRKNKEIILRLLVFGVLSLGFFIFGVQLLGWRHAIGCTCIVVSYRMGDLMGPRN